MPHHRSSHLPSGVRIDPWYLVLAVQKDSDSNRNKQIENRLLFIIRSHQKKKNCIPATTSKQAMNNRLLLFPRPLSPGVSLAASYRSPSNASSCSSASASASTMTDGTDSTATATATISSSTSNCCSKKHKKRMTTDFVPGHYSVLCGRGKICSASTGNQFLKSLVQSYLQQYSAAETKIAKTCIVSHIIAQVKSVQPVGAFIKFESGCWWEVDDSFAREKIGCQFRDILHGQYRSSTKSKLEAKKKRRKSLAARQKKKQKNKGGHDHHDEDNCSTASSADHRQELHREEDDYSELLVLHDEMTSKPFEMSDSKNSHDDGETWTEVEETKQENCQRLSTTADDADRRVPPAIVQTRAGAQTSTSSSPPPPFVLLGDSGFATPPPIGEAQDTTTAGMGSPSRAYPVYNANSSSSGGQTGCYHGWLFSSLVGHGSYPIDAAPSNLSSSSTKQTITTTMDKIDCTTTSVPSCASSSCSASSSASMTSLDGNNGATTHGIQYICLPVVDDSLAGGHRQHSSLSSSRIMHDCCSECCLPIDIISDPQYAQEREEEGEKLDLNTGEKTSTKGDASIIVNQSIGSFCGSTPNTDSSAKVPATISPTKCACLTSVVCLPQDLGKQYSRSGNDERGSCATIDTQPLLEQEEPVTDVDAEFPTAEMTQLEDLVAFMDECGF